MTNKIFHPPLYLNSATGKLTDTQKQLGLQLDSKFSFNKHANKIISKAKVIELFVSCNLFYHTETY